MVLTTMGDLARRHEMKLLFECQVEVEEKVIGKVNRTLTDKYGRVSGLEIDPAAESGQSAIVIPYEWISGIDEDRKVVVAVIPSRKTD
ncbi:MAG: hypothetical protein H8E46_12225 [FCB group bacterium]|nr:hypothetical protein [FCB group bacterium]